MIRRASLLIFISLLVALGGCAMSQQVDQGSSSQSFFDREMSAIHQGFFASQASHAASQSPVETAAYGSILKVKVSLVKNGEVVITHAGDMFANQISAPLQMKLEKSSPYVASVEKRQSSTANAIAASKPLRIIKEISQGYNLNVIRDADVAPGKYAFEISATVRDVRWMNSNLIGTAQLNTSQFPVPVVTQYDLHAHLQLEDGKTILYPLSGNAAQGHYAIELTASVKP